MRLFDSVEGWVLKHCATVHGAPACRPHPRQAGRGTTVAQRRDGVHRALQSRPQGRAGCHPAEARSHAPGYWCLIQEVADNAEYQYLQRCRLVTHKFERRPERLTGKSELGSSTIGVRMMCIIRWWTSLHRSSSNLLENQGAIISRRSNSSEGNLFPQLDLPRCRGQRNTSIQRVPYTVVDTGNFGIGSTP